MAAIIVGKPVAPKDEDMMMDAEEHKKMAEEGAEMAAQKMLEAIEKGDGKMLVKAFRMLRDMCHEEHEAEEEYDDEYEEEE